MEANCVVMVEGMFFSGEHLVPEYPDADVYTEAMALNFVKRMARHARDMHCTVRIVADYGLETEHVIATREIDNDRWHGCRERGDE